MKLSSSCYAIYGLTCFPPWMANTGFIAGKETTLIVDTGLNWLCAQTIFGYASTAKPDNVLLAINTEPHFDHIGGNCFFSEKNIDILGHKDINRQENEFEGVKEFYAQFIADPARKEAREENIVFLNTYVVNPNKKIEADTMMDLGNLEVSILHTPGHTSKNLSVFIPKEKVLYCGDTIVSDYIPNLEDGQKADWQDWLVSLDIIEKLEPEIVVPGHGRVLTYDQIGQEILRIKTVLNNALKTGQMPTA
ncbi:MAG: MBL fold metallo-hydrolase [Desulfobacteraceae bacterium]|nr:MBL fold metallo-hydrolase [Desulfobacteraceae bacterium]